MISVAFEKNISTAKKRDIAPFKVNGQSHIIFQQLSCGTNTRFLPSIVVEKNVHICSMWIKTN
jgi:hypothetical protein